MYGVCSHLQVLGCIFLISWNKVYAIDVFLSASVYSVGILTYIISLIYLVESSFTVEVIHSSCWTRIVI